MLLRLNNYFTNKSPYLLKNCSKCECKYVKILLTGELFSNNSKKVSENLSME